MRRTGAAAHKLDDGGLGGRCGRFFMHARRDEKKRQIFLCDRRPNMRPRVKRRGEWRGMCKGRSGRRSGSGRSGRRSGSVSRVENSCRRLAVSGRGCVDARGCVWVCVDARGGKCRRLPPGPARFCRISRRRDINPIPAIREECANMIANNAKK